MLIEAEEIEKENEKNKNEFNYVVRKLEKELDENENLKKENKILKAELFNLEINRGEIIKGGLVLIKETADQTKTQEQFQQDNQQLKQQQVSQQQHHQQQLQYQQLMLTKYDRHYKI
jgi:hypothetical protein